MASSPTTSLSASLPSKQVSRHALPGRSYRLVDEHGAPHPVLDDLYESLESAWSEALSWWREVAPEHEPIGIGVEVSTASGDWRTLRHPCS